jgi:Zn-finger nucleic acid-binding protein
MKSIACPKCVGPLQFGADPRGPVGTCYDCWGLWIDTPHLEKLREQYPVATPLYRATTRLRSEKADPSELLCPFCADQRLVQQVLRGVELEWCPSCRGIFLDKGERERLVGLSPAARGATRPTLLPAAKIGAALPVAQVPAESGSVFDVGEVLLTLGEILFAAFD